MKFHAFDPSADILNATRPARLESRPDAPDRRERHAHLRDGIRRIARAFQVDEDRVEPVSGRETPQQLPRQAGLAHPALRREQGVRAILNALGQRPQFRLPIEEPVAVDPVRTRFP